MNDPETCLLSVIQNKGIAFVPRCVSNRNSFHEFLFTDYDKIFKRYEFEEEFVKRKVYLIYRKDASMSDADKIFIEKAKEISRYIINNHSYPK